MLSSDDFQKAVKLINDAENMLLTTHTRPDGDACGSVAAISEALTANGKKIQQLILSDMPEWYSFLFSQKPSILGKDITIGQLKESINGKFDLIIIVDTNSYSQLSGFDEFLKQQGGSVLVIDHHLTSDALGNVQLVDTTAAAVGLIVLDLFKYAGWQITKTIAKALFVAVATDTGWFRFANTDSRVHRACSELIDLGVKPAPLYHQLYQNFTPARFKLMTAMLNSLELHLNDRRLC